MWLLIDAGNTRVKWALAEPQANFMSARLPVWAAEGSVAHADLDDAMLKELLPLWESSLVKRVVVSNVAGPAMRDKLAAHLATVLPMAKMEWFASSAHAAGLRNTYREPTQLGCDRFASAIGAHALFPQQDLVVATLGTATTVDAVSADGNFMGGMILPGLKLMAQALARNTAQLPQVTETVSVHRIFADNTDQAIVSGCINAQAGAIERAVASLSEERQTQAFCVISGGAAPYLDTHLNVSHQHLENLVLIGLYVIAISSHQL